MSFKEKVLNKLEKAAKESGGICYNIAIMDDEGTINCNPFRGSLCQNTYSVSKLFTVTAIEMLQDEGKLKVSDTVYSHLKEYFPEEYTKKWEEVTIDHCMRHRMGTTSGFLDIDAEEVEKFGTDDWLKYCFGRPVKEEPGTYYKYSDGAFYILSRIVEKVSGQDLIDYLYPRLFKPLGFTEVAWSKCINGHSMGATGLYIKAEECVRLGYIYLHDGMYEGKRILSSAAVKEVIDRQYELKSFASNENLRAKGGMFGQIIMIDLKNRLSIAWQCFDTCGVHDKLISACEEIL